MRSSTAAKLRRNGRSTVTLWKPKSSLSKTLLTARFRVRGRCVTGSSSGELASLAVLEVAVDAGQVGDLLVGQFVALVAETLTHLHEELPAIDELHLAPASLLLLVRDYPDVGTRRSSVEELLGERNDGFEPVVLDDPPPYLALPTPRVAVEKR